MTTGPTYASSGGNGAGVRDSFDSDTSGSTKPPIPIKKQNVGGAVDNTPGAYPIENRGQSSMVYHDEAPRSSKPIGAQEPSSQVQRTPSYGTREPTYQKDRPVPPPPRETGHSTFGGKLRVGKLINSMAS